MADVDALGFAQLLSSPQVNSPDYYTTLRARAEQADIAARNDQARQRAGQLFAQGRYQDAAAALAPADIPGAEGLQDRTSRQNMLAAGAAGNVALARTYGAQTGDDKTFQEGEATAQGVAAQRVLGLQTIAARLQDLKPQPGEQPDSPPVLARRAAALNGGISGGAYDQFGLTPDMVRQAFLADPSDLGDQHLAFAASPYPYTGVLKEKETAFGAGRKTAQGYIPPVVLNRGPGTSQSAYPGDGAPGAPPVAETQPGPVPVAPGYGLRDAQGNPVGKPQPFEAKPFTYPDGSGVGYVGGDGAVHLPGDPPRADGAPPGTPSPSPAGVAQSPVNGRGGHNGAGGQAANNPYNLHSPSTGGMWNGETDANPNGTANFATPAAADRAFGKVMTAYASRGISTPEAFVNTYASTSPANERAAYAQRVRQAVGDSFNLADPSVQAALKPAIFASEGTHLPTRAPKGPTGAPQPGTRAPTPVVPDTQYGLRGERRPDNSFQPTPGANFTIDNAMGARRDFYNSDTYKAADNAVTAANTLHRILDSSRDNSGLVSMAALDNTIRTQTGLSARANQVGLMMDHLGVPQEIRGKVSNVLGKGFLTPGVIEEAASIMDNYARTHVAAVQRRAESESAFARGAGFGGDLGLSVPQLTAPSTAKWLPKPSDANQVTPSAGASGRPAGGPPVRLQGGGAAARAQYAALPSGAQYYAPDGSLRTKR